MSIMSEDTKGPMKSLPGNVAIIGENGPEKGDKPAPKPSKSKGGASMTYAPGELPSDPAAPLPGQVFKESDLNEDKPATTEAPAPEPSPEEPANVLGEVKVLNTPEQPPAPEAPPAEEPPAEEPPAPTPEPEVEEPEVTGNFIRTEYITNGAVVSKILWEEELVTVTEQIDATTTVIAAPAATDARRRRHLMAHGHRHF